MSAESTLPARMYLLAYDLTKDKPSDKSWLDYVVRGAALAQLLAEGRLTDTGSAVVPAGGRPADEVLGLVYSEIEEAGPRDWRPLLHESKATLAAVEDQLVQTGVFERHDRGLTAVDRAAIAEVQERARQILGGHGTGVAGGGGGNVAVLDAALVALAFVIPLQTVFDRRRRRHDRDRVEALARLVSASVPGFERLLRQMRRTRGRAYSAGGPVH